MCKNEPREDLSVVPLEGLWWMEDRTKFSEAVKDHWLWTSMIIQPVIQALHDYTRDQGGKLVEANRHHHEIYLSDPRRSAPEKLETIVR